MVFEFAWHLLVPKHPQTPFRGYGSQVFGESIRLAIPAIPLLHRKRPPRDPGCTVSGVFQSHLGFSISTRVVWSQVSGFLVRVCQNWGLPWFIYPEINYMKLPCPWWRIHWKSRKLGGIVSIYAPFSDQQKTHHPHRVTPGAPAQGPYHEKCCAGNETLFTSVVDADQTAQGNRRSIALSVFFWGNQYSSKMMIDVGFCSDFSILFQDLNIMFQGSLDLLCSILPSRKKIMPQLATL